MRQTSCNIMLDVFQYIPFISIHSWMNFFQLFQVNKHHLEEVGKYKRKRKQQRIFVHMNFKLIYTDSIPINWHKSKKLESIIFNLYFSSYVCKPDVKKAKFPICMLLHVHANKNITLFRKCKCQESS